MAALRFIPLPDRREVLICGGRGYHPTRDDALWARNMLERFQAQAVLHGACVHRCGRRGCRARSVDEWGGEVGRRLGLEVLAFPPDYGRYPPKQAPLERNLMMLDREPVVVLALPGGSGTKHTCDHAWKRAIPVLHRRPF